MAEIRTKLIVDLPIGQRLDGVEILPVQQDGVTKKITTQNIIDFTKEQDYATWTNVASTRLLTNFLTAQNIFLVRQRSEFGNPQLFIGSFETSPESLQYQITSLSGFRLFYHEGNNNFVFTRQVSSSNSVQTLTAYYIDRFARTFIENLSTANTLSANKILITDNTANNALEIHQTGTGNALLIYDQAGDPTPFVVDSQGRVGIQTLTPNTELTIFGNLSASSNLSATNVFVLNNIGVGTSGRQVPEKLTVWGSISASNLFKDPQGNSNEWNSSYSTWRSLSSFHNESRSFVNVNSSTLIQVRTEVLGQSANNRSVYATWNSLSSFHQEARSFANINSSTLIQARSEVLANSGNWAKYNYVNSGFLPLSGGTITGNILNISAKTFYNNDVVIYGSLTATQFSVLQAQVLPITATRLDIDNELRVGKSLNVGTTGQIDGVFKVLGETTIDDIIVATNNIYTSGIFIDPKGNSNQWNSGYTTWNNLSARIADARTWTESNSSTLIQVRTEVLGQSANDRSVYGYVNSTSSNFILNGGNSPAAPLIIGTNNTQPLRLEANGTTWVTVLSNSNVGINNTNPHERLTVDGSISAKNIVFAGMYFYDPQGDSREWNSGYNTWNSLSSFHNESRSFVNVNSSTLIQVRTEVLGQSANNRSVYATWNSLSAFHNEARSFVNTNSSTLIQVRTEVLGQSANDRSVYATWNSLSAFHNEARSFVNTNSSTLIQVRTEVLGQSANNRSVYGYVNSTSSNFILNGGNSPASTLLIGTNNTQSLQLETNASAKVTILSGGNLGIGLINPSERLDVSGNIKASGTISAVGGSSSNWNSVYSTFQTTSAKLITLRGSQTLTTGQTTISVPSHNTAETIADVYLNGVKLINGVDYTDTGTQITLTKAAVNNEYTLEYLIAGLSNPVSNSVPIGGGTMTGALTVPGLTVNGPFNTTSSLATPTMSLTRQNTTIEGGELQFNRSIDNTSKYFIDVYGTSIDPDLRFFEKLGNSPSFTYPVRMVIQGSTGNVGIGTSNPTAKTYIYQDNAIQVGLAVQTNAGISGDALWISNAGNGIGTRIINSGSGAALVIDNSGSGNSLLVNDSGSGDTSPFVIDNNGNVGIGTTTPYAKLVVAQSGTDGCWLSGSSTDSWLGLGAHSSGASGAFRLQYQRTTGNITFNGGTRDTPVTRLMIGGTGLVGINTESPNERLTVVGNISASGKIYGDASSMNLRLPEKTFWKFRNRKSECGSGNLTAGHSSFCLSLDGRLNVAGYSTGIACWGLGEGVHYQVGGYTPTMPQLSGNDYFVDFWVSDYNIYAITNTGHLWGTGHNAAGQLGQGNTTAYTYWVPILGNVIDFSVSTGNTNNKHCLAVRSDGRVYGWGYNSLSHATYGSPLGLAQADVLVPTLIAGANSLAPVFGRTFTKVFAFKAFQDANYSWSFAIDNTGEVHAIGNNSRGQLGIGDTTSRSLWQRTGFYADYIYGVGYTSTYHNSYLLRSGEVWVAGRNNDGQLGLGPTGDVTYSLFTKNTLLGNNVADLTITLGGSYNPTVMSRHTDGTVRTWGMNNYGVLGHSGSTQTPTPTQPTGSLDRFGNVYNQLPFITKIIGGGGHGLQYLVALDINGDIWTSGYNAQGQKGFADKLDNNKFSKAIKPASVKFVDIDDVTGNQSGQTATLAADENGDMYVVGYANSSYGTGGITQSEYSVTDVVIIKKTRFV